MISDRKSSQTVAQPVRAADELRDTLRTLDRTIAKRELLLETVRDIQSTHNRRSDFGWFLSMVTLEAGTIFAVLSSKRARSWADLAHKLENEILLLRVEKKLTARELALTS